MREIVVGNVRFALWNLNNTIEIDRSKSFGRYGLVNEGESGKYELRFDSLPPVADKRVEIAFIDPISGKESISSYIPGRHCQHGAVPVPMGTQVIRVRVFVGVFDAVAESEAKPLFEKLVGSFIIDSTEPTLRQSQEGRRAGLSMISSSLRPRLDRGHQAPHRPPHGLL